MKFKVGDLVTVISPLPIKYTGKIGQIWNVDSNISFPYYVSFNNNRNFQVFKEKELELASLPTAEEYL